MTGLRRFGFDPTPLMIRPMTQTSMPAKAMILGCSGLALTADEKAVLS